MSAIYSFLPWVRQGLAAAIESRDTLDHEAPDHAALPISFRVNDRDEVRVDARLYGPGDVLGIDARQVVRTEPPVGARDFEANYFPAIEFDRPDFPWLFTPKAANDKGRLRPWLVLVVVSKQEGVSLRAHDDGPRAVLHIVGPAKPGRELPNLTESWAWAHAQVVSTGQPSDVVDLLGRDSTQTVSRLLCPRKLVPNTEYYACLVPAFASGVHAVLGGGVEAERDQNLAPAWRSGDAAPDAIRLPVYYHWEFATGLAGDFESLARRLNGITLDAAVGALPLRVEDLGFDLPDQTGLRLEGALRPVTSTTDTPSPSPAFQKSLRSVLSASTALSADSDPLLAPPVYGAMQSGQSQLAPLSDKPNWLNELNLDPRYRAAAGCGVRAVQKRQEQLMASAWQQLADAAQTNRETIARGRRTQFAQAVTRAILSKHFAPMPTARLLQVTAPLHTRVRMSPNTLHHVLGRSGALHNAVNSASFRRITRAQGPLARRLPDTKRVDNARLVEKFLRTPEAAPVKPIFAVVSPTAMRAELGKAVARKPSPEQQRLAAARKELVTYWDKTKQLAAPTLKPLFARTGDSKLKERLLDRLDPTQVTATALPAAIQLRFHVAAGAPAPVTRQAAHEFQHPQFSQPMYEALREISPELLLPGLEHIPADSVSLLETNPRFVEAFMVGLNHEFSRELLWREFPTPLNASYFQHFWDRRGHVGTKPVKMGKPIDQWQTDKALGEQFSPRGSDARLVLLIRGELLRRYPGTIIYAVKATSPTKLGNEILHPLFRGQIDPDISFLGFDLTARQARGSDNDPGWFFVLQQQPTEPRFGFDAPDRFGADPRKLKDWHDLSWGHLVDDPQAFESLNYVSVVGPRELANLKIASTQWGLNSAHMASITLQAPFRIARHARSLLPSDGQDSG